MEQLVKQLAPTQTADLKSQFEAIDEDKNGFLDSDELEKAYSIFQKSSGMTKQDFDTIMKKCDTDHDSKINYNEFLAASVDITTILTKEKLASIFAQFDSDGDGLISQENIQTAFSKFGVEISEE